MKSKNAAQNTEICRRKDSIKRTRQIRVTMWPKSISCSQYEHWLQIDTGNLTDGFTLVCS